MAKIVGNVKPEDDYTHPLGPEPNFNESVYFNFFDREQQRGGFLRIGNRANEGYAEMTVIVYEPDGSALFNYKRPAITSNDGWDAGGLKVEVVEPTERIRTTYEGSVVFLADPRSMSDPGKAFKESPHRKLKLDLLHQACGPLYGHVGKPRDGNVERQRDVKGDAATAASLNVERQRDVKGDAATAASLNDFARAHFEQHMRVTGTLSVDGGATVQLAGHGLRDHSWGPRYWQSTPSYRWITGNFGDDLGMVISVIGGKPGGVMHKGDQLHRITDVRLDTDYEPGTKFHRALRAELTLENGVKHLVEGTVKGFIPLRNRRAGMNTNIGEGMTEYLIDGERKGYGLSEYLDQPEAPAAGT